ncbi:hypothetical protein HBI56_008000 [Parastagonospora nodorum]|nr:hypothetical protein HBH56_121720 [Parastagonospora nodorum]KAH3935218.1 hypothetical protein HBH54_047270 [Parastagonospora nodorum]KAH3950241.1 hypothetical protein HBH53_076700 [Parastagonospora nodorum]KAH3986673.1 hypothetical protein HBH51_009780 [Parastagonospora nodorum]KAH3987318.1 hypothetical protein HBH52_037640 [Parastagonospora nodorum]
MSPSISIFWPILAPLQSTSIQCAKVHKPSVRPSIIEDISAHYKRHHGTCRPPRAPTRNRREWVWPTVCPLMFAVYCSCYDPL